jgi:predicted permease
VVAFSAGVSLLVGVLSSIGPALRATRVEAAETLRAAGNAATRRESVGTSLAAAQLGASLTLLIGAYLLGGTLAHLWRVPLGFDPDHLFVVPVQPNAVGYSEAASYEYVDEFQRRLAGVPGVRSVAAAKGAPFVGGASMVRTIRSSDAPPDVAVTEVRSHSVFSPSYFETTAMPLLEGRTFSLAEIEGGRRGESRVVILSQNLARRLFGAVPAVGRGIEFARQGRAGERREIIGVAATARYDSLVKPAEDVVYEPGGPKSLGISTGAAIIVRTDGSVPLAARATSIASALNPSLPLMLVLPMSSAVAKARADWESLAIIVGVLTVIATALACIGLYGVVAHAVAERRRELGIRIALGATRAQVWKLVLRRAAIITGCGLVVGLAGGVAFTRLISTRLVGVSPYDPLAWTLAAVSLAAVAGLAALGPARAAMRVDVSETLRAL